MKNTMHNSSSTPHHTIPTILLTNTHFQEVIQDFFARGGNWIGGDHSKRGTVFIYIHIDVHFLTF